MHAEAWRQAIHELAALERPSASEGERLAAESIASRLRELGCAATVERESAHAGYWWPLELNNLLAFGAALLALRNGGRPAPIAAALVSGTAAAALWDDLGHGRRWSRRLLLRQRSTWNVVARGERSRGVADGDVRRPPRRGA